MSRKFLIPMIALAALSAFSVAACNTVRGAGEDIQGAGQAIERTAQEANDGNPNTP